MTNDILKQGEILQVQEYNKQLRNKWKEDFKNSNPFEAKPQLMTYVFLNSKGDYQKRGYVGRTKHHIIYSPTKKELLKELVK